MNVCFTVLNELNEVQNAYKSEGKSLQKYIILVFHVVLLPSQTSLTIAL